MPEQVALPWFGLSDVSVCGWLAAGVKLMDRPLLQIDGLIVEIKESTIPSVSPVITAYFRRGAAATSSIYQAKISLPSNSGTYFIDIDDLPDYVADYVSPVFFPLYNKDQQWSGSVNSTTDETNSASSKHVVEETCEDIRTALHEFPLALRPTAFIQHNRYCDLSPRARASTAKNTSAKSTHLWQKLKTSVADSHNITVATDECVEYHHSDNGVLSYCTSAKAAAAAEHSPTAAPPDKSTNPLSDAGDAISSIAEELLNSTTAELLSGFNSSTENPAEPSSPVFKPNLVPNENLLDDALYFFLLVGPPYVQGSQLLSICESQKSMKVAVYTSYSLAAAGSTAATPPPLLSYDGPTTSALQVAIVKPVAYYDAPLSGYEEDKYFERVGLRSQNYRVAFPYSSANGTLVSSLVESQYDMPMINPESHVCSCFLVRTVESLSGVLMAATVDMPKSLFPPSNIRLRAIASNNTAPSYEFVYGSKRKGLTEIADLCSVDLLPVRVPYLCVSFERYYVPVAALASGDYSEDCASTFPEGGSVCRQQPLNPFNDNTFNQACIPLLPSVPYKSFSAPLDEPYQIGVSDEKLTAAWLQLRTSDSPSADSLTIDGATVRVELPPTWEINPGFIAAQWTLLQRPICNDTSFYPPDSTSSPVHASDTPPATTATSGVTARELFGKLPPPVVPYAELERKVHLDRRLQESEVATLHFEIGAGRDCRSSGCNGRGECRGGKFFAVWLRYHCRCEAEYGGPACEFEPNSNPHAKISFLTYSNVVGFLAPLYILILIAGIFIKTTRIARKPTTRKPTEHRALCFGKCHKSVIPFVASTSHGHGNLGPPRESVVSGLRLKKDVDYRSARRMDDTSTFAFLLLVALLLTTASVISAIYHQCDTQKSCPGVYMDTPYNYYTARHKLDASDWTYIVQNASDTTNYTRIDPIGFTYNPIEYANSTAIISHRVGVWSSFDEDLAVRSLGSREFLLRRQLNATTVTTDGNPDQHPWWTKFFLGIWLGENSKIQFMRWQVNDFWSAFSSMGAMTVVVAQVSFPTACMLLFYAVASTVVAFHFLPATAPLTSLICLAIYISIIVPRILAWYVFSKRIRTPALKLRNVLLLSIEDGCEAFMLEMYPRAAHDRAAHDRAAHDRAAHDRAADSPSVRSTTLGSKSMSSSSSSVAASSLTRLSTEVSTQSSTAAASESSSGTVHRVASRIVYIAWKVWLRIRMGTAANFKSVWALCVALLLTAAAVVFWYLSSAGTAYWFFHSFWHMTVFGSTIFYLWAVYGNPLSPPLMRVPDELKFVRIH